MKGDMWITVMGKVKIDTLTGENFSEPHDRILMREEELRDGIDVKLLKKRLHRIIKQMLTRESHFERLNEFKKKRDVLDKQIKNIEDSQILKSKNVQIANEGDDE